MKLTFKNNFKNVFASFLWIIFIKQCEKGTEFVPVFNNWLNPMQPVASTLTTTVQQNRAITELRSISDHCAYTTAWSWRSWSFDLPVRTGDVIKFQVVLSPVLSAAGRSEIEIWERGLTRPSTAGGLSKPLGGLPLPFPLALFTNERQG